MRPHTAPAATIVCTATALFLAPSGVGGAAALTVGITDDAAALAAGLSLDGVTIVGTPTLTAPRGAAGLFSAGTGDGLDAASGVLLSTGLASDAVGPNDAADTGDGVGGPGSDLLTTSTGSPTFDAATFELDFTLDAGFDGIELSYAFATEEFPEFTGEGLGDALRIFVDGVSVGGADTASGGFFDNSGTIDAEGLVVPASAPLDIEFDGIKSTLTAVALNLDEGPHTLTVVLADVDDEFVDSAVFLSSLEGSIIPTPSAAVAGLALLAAGAARRRRTIAA